MISEWESQGFHSLVAFVKLLSRERQHGHVSVSKLRRRSQFPALHSRPSHPCSLLSGLFANLAAPRFLFICKMKTIIVSTSIGSCNV